MSSKLAFVCVYVFFVFPHRFSPTIFVCYPLCLLVGELADEARRQMVRALNAVNR